MRRLIRAACLASTLCVALPARAFCGFYVAKADAELFNHASQVVLVRDGTHTVLTMANDYKGELTEFAVVIPVPTVLKKEQIHIGDPKLVAHLDGWSGPRLVEYFDRNPCEQREYPMERMAMRAKAAPMAMAQPASAASLGVKIEAEYTIGEYDIVLLSATQSSGLSTWLKQEGYRIPAKAENALEPYIKQDMKFFVAKVNLKEQSKLGFKTLRPIEIAYDSEKFMLPIRLGMANADGPQDLVVYTLTRKGRVESVNYRTVKMPSEEKVPLFVKEEFPNVYKAIFETSYLKEDHRALFTEYAWSSGWCDPCSEPPLSPEELRGLGVFWLDDPAVQSGPVPGRPQPMYRRPFNNPDQPFVTRLHVRYDRDHFPEDLVFQETGDRTNYQARYILNHPYQGEMTCPAADGYRKSVDDRHELEATTLAALTGWPRDEVVRKMGGEGTGPVKAKDDSWYKRIWK